MTNKNLMVKALAGTGKTTTMIWSVGSVPRGIKLTDEQQAIRSWFTNQRIDRFRFMAFNKSIATELSKKVPGYCEAGTCHSFGLSIIRMNNAKGARVKVDSWKYRKIMDKLFGEPKKSADYQLRNAANSVIDLARVHLLGSKKNDILVLDEQDLDTLLLSNDIDTSVGTGLLLDMVNKSLAIGSKDTKTLDFADMIWAPVFHKMKTSKVGGLIVDECQDLSKAQQELVMMQGEQIICVGDVNQAIYGFAGADAASMECLENTLANRGGVDVLPLTVTRRCGKQIVDLAKTIVPSYRAADSNPKGSVINGSSDTLVDDLQTISDAKTESTMVLCRTNAPLVGLAFQLLRKEIPVIIRGRDIGAGLIKLVEKLADKSDDIGKMIDNLMKYADQEAARINKRYKYGADEKLVALEDKVDCIRVLASDCSGVTELTNKLTKLFQDRDGGKHTIVLSSAHRAKGLESDNVFIYRPELLPHPKLMEKANGSQEINLQYVAYTRAIHRLVLVISK